MSIDDITRISQIITDEYFTEMNYAQTALLVARAFFEVVAGDEPHPAFCHAFHQLGRRDPEAAHSLMENLKILEQP